MASASNAPEVAPEVACEVESEVAPEVAPDASLMPGAARTEAWRDPVQRTDEIELLISAAVFFGLLQVPGRLVEWWSGWSAHQLGSALDLGVMLMQIGYGVVFALLVSFFVHLVLRGLWIGLIGLRSAFPLGIDWAKLARSAPIATEYQKAHTPTIESVIAKVDRLASVIFICASLLVGMTLFAAVLIIPVFFFGERLSKWFLYALLIVLIIPAALQLLLDNVLASRSPRWAAKPWVRRIVTTTAAVYSRLMPRNLLLAPMLTMQSRLPHVAFAVGVMLTMMVVMLAFPLHLVAQRNSDAHAPYALVDDAIARHGITLPLAGDESASHVPIPRLDRVQVNGPWVELFLPLRPRRDDAPLRNRCPAYAGAKPESGIDAKHALELRDCMAGLWRVTLDGKPIQAAAFELARKGSQRGLLAMLPTAALTPGRHQIVATRLPIRVNGERFHEPPPRSLLFWVAGQSIARGASDAAHASAGAPNNNPGTVPLRAPPQR